MPCTRRSAKKGFDKTLNKTFNEVSKVGELWDIYDKERRQTGKFHKRGTPLKHGEYHLVVEVWTVSKEGKILLTKRHPDKNCGGMWECAGGAVLAGEDSLSGAKRELLEETGIQIEDAPFILAGTVVGNNWIVDTYMLNKNVNLEALRLQPEEVIDAKWVTIDEMRKMHLEGIVVPSVMKRFKIYHNQILEHMGNAGNDYLLRED